MSIISNKDIKTRKPHTCWGCAIEYPKGTTMQCIVDTEGGIEAYYWCKTCQEVIEQSNTTEDDGINMDDLPLLNEELWAECNNKINGVNE